jgi:hypothetical protein
MSNTIDLDLESVNKMNTLSFHWIATFDDGCIFQFEDGKENKFQEVLDRITVLRSFTLKHKDTGLAFTVDLTKGLVYLGKNKYLAEEFVKQKNNIRLIYFRRNRVELGEKGNQLSHMVFYFLGYQYVDNAGNNHKVIMQIDSEGNWVLGD